MTLKLPFGNSLAYEVLGARSLSEIGRGRSVGPGAQTSKDAQEIEESCWWRSLCSRARAE